MNFWLCAWTISSLLFFPVWRRSCSGHLPDSSAPTQLDSNSETSDEVETMSSENEAEEEVVFDLEIEKASEKEQDIGREVAKEMTQELVEAARSLVEERYAIFIADLDDVVKKYNPNAEEDLKDTWMSKHYFTTIKNFLHIRNNGFRHDIDLEVLPENDKALANELHAKLQRDDESAVKNAVQEAFNKYFESLDDVQRQVHSKTDEAMSSLKDCWLPNHYISILSAYIDFEKDKFKPHACVALLSPEDKAKVDQVSLKLRASNAADVDALLDEKWATYFTSMDAMLKKAGNIEDVKTIWMTQQYANVLEQYVNAQHDKVAETYYPKMAFQKSGKRDAGAAALDTSLSPEKTAKTTEPFSQLRRFQHGEPSSSKNNEKGSFTKDNDAQRNGFTPIEELGHLCVSSYSICGKVLTSMKDVQMIETKKGGQLAQFRYVLGDNTGVCEVTKVGQQSYSLMNQVHDLYMSTVTLSKAQWNDDRKQLQHTHSTVLQSTPATSAQFEDVKFPVQGDWLELPKLADWARVSVYAFVTDPGESLKNDQDGKNGKGWLRDATISNEKCQGMNLRIIHPNEDDFEFFEYGAPVFITYAKKYMEVSTQICMNSRGVAEKRWLVNSCKESVLLLHR